MYMFHYTLLMYRYMHTSAHTANCITYTVYTCVGVYLNTVRYILDRKLDMHSCTQPPLTGQSQQGLLLLVLVLSLCFSCSTRGIGINPSPPLPIAPLLVDVSLNAAAISSGLGILDSLLDLFFVPLLFESPPPRDFPSPSGEPASESLSELYTPSPVDVYRERKAMEELNY